LLPNHKSANQKSIQFHIVPVEAILTWILFPIVAWTNLEEEVTQVLSGYLNRNIDPLTRCVLACDDPSVTPGTSYVQLKIIYWTEFPTFSSKRQKW
jgi:hypothetical protein